ncbi:hypothetical protein [Lichenifustis flavocetrariae]|uniref:Uncharacterized protein n=1 Tax=Lichenifustis flavocetrariae TaxID=2949735 RepID=A0AA41YX73_9HYPH|nr:hypothetical protein [Lichenifustis flavocetrariae]MCW6506593.1 hypothetical protein [Lichenifustis flavocetrariae]
MAIRFEEKGKDDIEPGRKEKPLKARATADAGSDAGPVGDDVALPFAKPVKSDKKRPRAKR